MRLGGWTRRLEAGLGVLEAGRSCKDHSLTAQIDSRSSQTIPEAPGSCQKLGKSIFQWFSKIWVARLGVLEARLGVLESRLNVLEAGLCFLEAGLGVLEARLGVMEAGLSCKNYSLTAQIDSRSSQTIPEAPGSCQKFGTSIFQWFSKVWVYGLGVLEAGL